jgi:hypothetical protein
VAIEPDTGHRLDFRFGDMAVQPNREFPRQFGAASDEPIRAMMRDRRRYRGRTGSRSNNQ